MFKLPNPARVMQSAGAYWNHCAGCDALFPAAPGQIHCRECHQARLPDRCAAAHCDDRSRCDGPHDAVRVVDQVDDEVYGCVHHASVALASIEDARVYPVRVQGAAIEAFRRAQLREPFNLDPVAPWPVPDRCAGSGER